MEKTFLRLKNRPNARHAFIEAESMTAIATQIRVLRVQRGWTQIELARKLRSSQAVISRMEDPSYGRLSLRSLVELAKVFDTGLQVRFVSLVKQLRDTWVIHRSDLEVPSFEDEAANVGFVSTLASPSPISRPALYVVPANPSETAAIAGSFDISSKLLGNRNHEFTGRPVTLPLSQSTRFLNAENLP